MARIAPGGASPDRCDRPRQRGSPQTLESCKLFGSAREGLIRHGTETYRLRETKAGKLIRSPCVSCITPRTSRPASHGFPPASVKPAPIRGSPRGPCRYCPSASASGWLHPVWSLPILLAVLYLIYEFVGISCWWVTTACGPWA